MVTGFYLQKLLQLYKSKVHHESKIFSYNTLFLKKENKYFVNTVKQFLNLFNPETLDMIYV